MRFRTDVSVLKPTVRTLTRWAQGSAYTHFRHAEMRVENGLLRFTMTTPLGTAHLSCDAEVDLSGAVGVDINLFAKFLAPVKGNGWELDLSLEPDPEVEGRQLFVARFREDGCKRSTFNWPYTGRSSEFFTNTDWVPEPVSPSGVVREFRAPRPRLLQLLQAGLSAHSLVEKNTTELHTAGLTVAADMAAAYTLNAKWGVRAQLWADGDLGFSTGWEGEPETLSLDAMSLAKATGIVDAFGGVDPWVVQVPEKGPIRLCPASAPTDAWVTVPQMEAAVNLPELLDEVRSSKDGRGGMTYMVGTVALNSPTFGKLRSLITELEILAAYAAADKDADIWTLAFEENHLVIEAISTLHIGAGVRIPWVDTIPTRAVVRSVSGKCLLAALKAVTSASEPDALVSFNFWASDHLDLERFYLSTASEKGEAADALVMPYQRDGGQVRLAEMTKTGATNQ